MNSRNRFRGIAASAARKGDQLLRRAARAGAEDGQSLVEFALTSTILLSFIFGLIAATLAFYSFNVASECAREGTRYAMVRGSSCTTAGGSSCTVTAAQVNAYVSGIGYPNLGGGTMTVNTTYPDGNETPQTSRVQVTVQYVFPVRVPFVPTRSFTMASTSTAYIVQ